MRRGRLIAIDGLDAGAVRAAARAVAAESGRAGLGVSFFDASGVFDDLRGENGAISPRTLLLLYAADLAFRLRWEIGPEMEEGRSVVAAGYVPTAVAFGRAVGLPAAWLSNLFRFAPRPSQHRHVAALRTRSHGEDGFVDVVVRRWAKPAGVRRDALTRQMARYLRPRRGRR